MLPHNLCTESLTSKGQISSLSAINLCKNVHIFCIVLPNRPELSHPGCVSALFLPLSNTYSKPTDLCHSSSLQRYQTDKKIVCPATVRSRTHNYTLLFHIMSSGLTLSAVARGKIATRQCTGIYTHTERNKHTHP